MCNFYYVLCDIFLLAKTLRRIKMEIREIINNYFRSLNGNEKWLRTHVYNEASLQHDLGQYLQKELVGNIVQYERNINFYEKIKNDSKKPKKSESDIMIVKDDDDLTLISAIEIKYHSYFTQSGNKRGAFDISLAHFLKDIELNEFLKNKFQSSTFSIFIYTFPKGQKPSTSNDYSELFNTFINNENITLDRDQYDKIKKQFEKKNKFLSCANLNITGEYKSRFDSFLFRKQDNDNEMEFKYLIIQH